MGKVLDKLYIKYAKLETEQPPGYQILLKVINKQIELFEKHEEKSDK